VRVSVDSGIVGISAWYVVTSCRGDEGRADGPNRLAEDRRELGS
jgi:hypothetical protein